MPLPTEVADLLAARESGHTCAVAGHVQRDLQKCAERHSDLFPARPFDAAFLCTIALANTFCAPWSAADGLRLGNRITMWIFGVDRLIDHLATSRAEIEQIVRRCVAVADGAPARPGDPVTGFLAEIRDELAAAPAFEAMREVWCDEVRRMLETMMREWEWKTAHAADPASPLPTLDEYLDNAEFGFSLVFVTHWIATTQPAAIGDVTRLRTAGWAVQQVIRLLNDFGTYHRDVSWGDLNALLLGLPREEVTRRLASLVDHCHELLRPLKTAHWPLAVFLERHIGFNTGYYAIADYWGEL